MRISILSAQRLCYVVGLLMLASPTESEDPGSCESGETAACKSSSLWESEQESPSSFCIAPVSLYDNGGSAQTYRPGAPLSNEVCQSPLADEYRYKAASWPLLRRSMRKGSAPKLDVTLNIWSCESSSDSKCVCKPIDADTAKSARSVVEIWQARPNGLYSSLRSLMPDSNECRAQVPLSDSGMAKFTTVAPGSTGLMGGIGPGGWEWSPYGPPVIHMLVRAKGHAPLLVDLPILVQSKTLEPRKFSIGDFRGVAWARKKPEEIPLKIRSWNTNLSENRITMEVDLFLQPTYQDQPEFCSSYMYGLPSSFFLEPMSVCAPSMLDFFAV